VIGNPARFRCRKTASALGAHLQDRRPSFAGRQKIREPAPWPTEQRWSSTAPSGKNRHGREGRAQEKRFMSANPWGPGGRGWKKRYMGQVDQQVHAEKPGIVGNRDGTNVLDHELSCGCDRVVDPGGRGPGRPNKQRFRMMTAAGHQENTAIRPATRRPTGNERVCGAHAGNSTVRFRAPPLAPPPCWRCGNLVFRANRYRAGRRGGVDPGQEFRDLIPKRNSDKGRKGSGQRRISRVLPAGKGPPGRKELPGHREQGRTSTIQPTRKFGTEDGRSG